MVCVHLLFFYVLDSHNYQETQKGTMCGDLIEIKTEAECKKAATKLGIRWASAWNGPNDFPSCLHAQDGRNTAYFNLSPTPGRTNLNKKYSAICKITEGMESMYLL